MCIGRSFREAPEVDGVIAIKGVKDVPCGGFLNVRINAVTEHDMEAEVVVDEGNFLKKLLFCGE